LKEIGHGLIWGTVPQFPWSYCGWTRRQSGQPLSGPKIESGTCQMWSRSSNHLTAEFGATV
jgi:hypothetical protein